MANTYTKLYAHLIFATKTRMGVIKYVSGADGLGISERY